MCIWEVRRAKSLAENALKHLVHLVFGEPKREGGDFVGEVVNLNPEKMGERDARKKLGLIPGGEGQLGLRDKRKLANLIKTGGRFLQLAELFEYFVFEQPQLFVGDDEEIAGAAGGVENADFGEPFEELPEPSRLESGGEKFVEKFIQKKRLNDLHDIRHARVMHTQPAALLGIDNGLNHRPKNVGIDVFPLQTAAFEQNTAAFCRKNGGSKPSAKQPAIDIREGGEVIGQVGSGVFGRVKGFKKAVEVLGEVAAVGIRVAFDGVGELVFFGKNLGVFGKEAEKKAREKDVEGVFLVGGFGRVFLRDLVIELAHFFGSFYVGGVFGLINRLFHSCKGEEKIETVGQIDEECVEGIVVFGVKSEQVQAVGDEKKAGRRLFLARPFFADGIEKGGQIVARERVFEKDFAFQVDFVGVFGKVESSLPESGNRGFRGAKRSEQVVKKRSRRGGRLLRDFLDSGFNLRNGHAAGIRKNGGVRNFWRTNVKNQPSATVAEKANASLKKPANFERYRPENRPAERHAF